MEYKSIASAVSEVVKKQYSTIIFVKPVFNLNGVDLMLKGGKFFAFYDPVEHLWVKDERRMLECIDDKLDKFCEEMVKQGKFERKSNGSYISTEGSFEVKIQYLRLNETKQLSEFKRWLSILPPDFNTRDRRNDLDKKLTFEDEVKDLKLTDYRSKYLPYVINPKIKTTNYDKLMKVLYSPEERQKLEWAIGSILAGESNKIDKMVVIYGGPGTGKSTVLDLIKQLFDGYWTVYSANELADKNYQFSTAMFRDNPLVAIQDDGSMGKIDSTTINSIISHAEIQINEKGKQQYTIRPNAMLFLATNDLVDLRDTNHGIARRIIDVYPTGNTVDYDTYCDLEEKIQFEISGIAAKCLNVYKKLGRKKYIRYRPEQMIQKVNVIFNFVKENYDRLVETDPIHLNTLYKMYKQFCEDSGLTWSVNKMKFAGQIREYYDSFSGDMVTGIKKADRDNKFSGFRTDIFDEKSKEVEVDLAWLNLTIQPSFFDERHKDCPAQLANADGIPKMKWKNVRKTLEDINTSELHYVKIPENEIVIDFDIPDENGNKSFELNLAAAKRWPETYAELSKSGQGIHLHYIYNGDVDELDSRYDDHIEIKVFKGDSSLRRKLTKCNDILIAHLDGVNLPKKKRKNTMVNKETVRNDKILRSFIFDCLDKKHHGATKPEVDFIKAKLDEYYNSGVSYDVRDMRTDILSFAMKSSHQADKAVKVVSQMKFCSEEFEGVVDDNSKPIIFYDIEVFPNLFLVNWKYEGSDKPVMRMINPTPTEVENLVNSGRLIGFNNRRYDNHILYARMMGYTIEELYSQSQAIINGDGRKGFFGEAYNLSYTDVYDFSNKKQSLKKWEIELDIHHQELGLPWDQPVPEEMWTKVAEYCDNDVIATEAVFNACNADWTARQILAEISGLSVNDTTNNHTCQIIFGDVKHPQTEFIYTDLSKEFPGYKFENGKSTYRGEETGEGGYVYAEPGVYKNIALMDIASMHPTSAEVLGIFGPYTVNFSAIKQARIYIKHGDYEDAGKLFDGKLKKYLTDKGIADDLSFALKIAINSVYGLTSAKFDNRCRDPRNVDNIVAKRGALFMINLKNEVQKQGFKVAHIKTDSIKIPDATPEILNFIVKYGESYGYTFEHEATYSKMCLVNDAVYIAQYADVETCERLYGKEWVHKDEDTLKKNKKKPLKWDATGAEFQHPYIFKTLFSHEELTFKDLCEVKTVQSALYLDMNENLKEGEHDYQFVGKAGSFCPIKPGFGGGELMRLQGEKYYSAAGAKGYRWLEAETVKTLGKEDDIDMLYFENLADSAKKHIEEFGNFEMFVGSEIGPANDFMNIPLDADEEIPFE